MNKVTEMSSGSPKQALFREFAEVAKALAHGVRLELLEHLAQKNQNVESLARLTGVSVASVSQHLQKLRHAGLVVASKHGKQVIYRLKNEQAVDLLDTLERFAERNTAEVRQVISGYFNDRDSMEPVSKSDLLERVRQGTAIALDVRPADEFDVGHLKGAINIPLAELEKHMADLPPGKDIIAYCRGPYCVLSYEAVAALREKGYTVFRLDGGYPDWKVSGLPVTTRAQ